MTISPRIVGNDFEPAGKHLTEIVKRGENVGQFSRPYMNPPLTMREIMSAGEGVADATFEGSFNWSVKGTFRVSEGTGELGLNPKTKVIDHFNFVRSL